MEDNSYAGGGKIRPRRATSQRKPYSRGQKKSFFTKVSDSVKSILNPFTPRWLVNFRGNDEPQSSTQSDDQVVEESSSLQSSELLNHTNNNLKQTQLSRPPLRNFHASGSTSPGSSSYNVSEETRPKTVPGEAQLKTTFPGKETGKEGLLKHLDRMASKRAKLETDSPLMSDSSYLRSEMKLLSTNDNASVASSSGCSSVQMNSQRNDVSDNESIGNHVWNSKDTSLSSLPGSSRQQATMGSSKKPRFNPSIFGMPSLGMTSPDPRRSSFYEGSVQFGGANASGRSPYFATPYKIPSVTKVKVRHVHRQRPAAKSPMVPRRNASLPLDETMSSTAKKILQTLEKMSSPLNDAKKIPTIPRTPSSYAAMRSRRQTQDSSSLLQNSSTAPPITGLTSPSVVKLRRRTKVPLSNSLLKRKDTEMLSSSANVSNIESTVSREAEMDHSTKFEVPDSRAIAARGLPGPIASLSSSVEMARPNKSTFNMPTTSGGGGKMKSGKRSSNHYTSPVQEDDVLEEHPLPNITLPVSSLPSFNFATKEMTSTPAATPAANAKRIVKEADNPKFSFASPIVKTSQSDPTCSVSDTPKFQFSSPPPKGAQIQDTPKIFPSKSLSVISKPVAASAMTVLGQKAQPAMMTITKVPSPLAGSPKPQTSTKAAEPLKAGSVMDILGGKGDNEKDVSAGNEPLPFKAMTSGWTCKICMVPNEDSDNACVACATPRPNSNTKVPLSKAFPVSRNKGWDCETCLVPNDASRDKCEACETPRSGTSASAGGFKPTEFRKEKPTISFGLPSKSETDTTGTKKTVTVPGFGSKTTSSEAAKSVTFSFGIPPTKSTEISSQSSSKESNFGSLAKKPSGQWECEVCMIPNSTDRKTCEACDSPKPGTKAVSNTSFKFGESSSDLFKFSAPTPKEGDGNNVTKSQTLETATQTSQSIATSKPAEMTKPTFSFGAPTTAAAAATTPRLGVVTKTDAPAKPAFSFGQKSGDISQANEPGENVDKPKIMFGIPPKNDPVCATSPPMKPAASQPQPQGLPMFGTKISSSSVSSTKTLPSIVVPPASTATVAFGASGPVGKPSFPVFGSGGVTSSSGLGAKPSFPSAFKTSQEKGTTAEPKSESAAPSMFSFNPKPPAPESQVTATKQQPPPAFSFTAKKPDPPPFGSTSSGNVTSTTSGFGGDTGFKPAGNTMSQFENKAPLAFGATGTKFAGFGQTPKPSEATGSEPPKPAFGGFGTVTSSAASQSAGGAAGIFSSASKPAPAPFGGGGSSTTPAFGSGIASAVTPFGASNANSSSTPFGGQSSSTVFGGSSGGNSVFGASASNVPSKPAGFSFGSSNTQSTTGSFQFGAGSSQSTPQQPSGTGFNFGSSNQSSSKSGGFAFGGGSASQSGGVFQFGAGGSQSALPGGENKAGLFGSNQNTQPSNDNKMSFFAGGNQSSNNPPSGFNFGASAAVPTFNFTGNQQSGMSGMGAAPAFGAGSTPTPNMFDPGRSTTPTQAGRRVIKTARRKLRK